MLRRVGPCVLGALLVFSSLAQGADYYIAPTGSDAAAGSVNAPWGTLGRAQTALTSGDVLYCRGGEYVTPDDMITLGASNVTIRNHPGETPVFRTVGSGSGAVVTINGDDVVVDGLEFRPLGTVRGQICFLANGDRAIFRNIVVDAPKVPDGRYAFGQILRIHGDNVEVTRSQLSGAGDPTVPQGHAGQTIVVFGNSAYIHDNHLQRGVHDVIAFFGPTNGSPIPDNMSVVRNNVITHAVGYGIGTYDANKILIERNTITGCDEELAYVKNPIFINGDDTIVRFNVGWNNEIYGYSNHYGARNRFYNNVFWGNGSDGFNGPCSASPSRSCSDNKHVNNVIANNMRSRAFCQQWYAEIYLERDYEDPAMGNVFTRNYIVANDNGWQSDHGCAVFVGTQAQNPGFFRVSHFDSGFATWNDNFVTYCDPMFVDPDAGDFTTREGSCLEDAGYALTIARSDGNGTAVPVQDAYFFWPGDDVVIGGPFPLHRVVSVDYEAGTLNLEASTSWSAGDAVTLPYGGDAPDIGVYERGSPTPIEVQGLNFYETLDGIQLTWSLSEDALADLEGVDVFRASHREGPYVKTSHRLAPERTMTWQDQDVQIGMTYWYRLMLVGESGIEAGPSIQAKVRGVSSVSGIVGLSPRRDARGINVHYVVATPEASVQLRVFNVAGRRVRQLDTSAREPGVYSVVWDALDAGGRRVPRGVYIVELRAGDVRSAEKLVLTRQ